MIRLVFATFWVAAALLAATQRGHVVSGGQPIPAATVTAAQAGRKLVTTTDEAGNYAFGDLAPGAWSIQVEMFGFVTARREVTVASGAGADSPLEWSLELKPRVETELAPALDSPPPEPQPEPPPETRDANEAFLVQGSLSQGLQAFQEEKTYEERRAEWDQKIKQARGSAAPQMRASAGQLAAPRAGKPGKAGKAGKAARFAAARRATMSNFGNRRRKNAPAFQGSAYFTLRNSALDARPYSLTGQTAPKPSYAQARFGFAAGGLLRIPKLLELQRTFFFFNYSGTRSRNPYSAFAFLPGAAERAGDFSRSQVRGPVTVFDPTNGRPFPDNRIPATRINPVAQGLLEFMPLPNQPGRLQNYQVLASLPQNTDAYSFRFNQPFTRRDRLSLGVASQRRTGQNSQLYGFHDDNSGAGLSSDLGWNRNFGPRTILNVRWRLNRNRSQLRPYFAWRRDVAGELGIRGTSRDPINYGPPNLGFTNFGGLADGVPSLRRDQNSAVNGGLTRVHGKHNAVFGGEYRRTQLNSLTYSNARGGFSFSGLATSGFDTHNQPLPFTGFDFADFLLGLPQSSSLRFGSDNTYFREAAFSVYGQDEWRLRSNLTLNLGVRYEFFTPMKEKYGHIANLDIAPAFTGVAVVTPGVAGPYSGAFPSALIDSDPNNVSPRVGVAWKPVPRRKTVVRAGYGIFYDGSLYTRFASRLASQPPFARTAYLTTSLARRLTLEDGFAATPSEKVTNTFAVDRGYRLGYAQTWSLYVQQELRHGLVAELGYLGTKGTRLDMQRSPNRALPGSPLTAEQRRLIGNAVGFTFDSSEGNSIYHAVQVRLTRRFRKGLSANAFYTFSKSIDNASSIGGVGSIVAQNDKDLSSERGLSSFSQRHLLNVYYVLTSPVAGSRLLRNWQLSGGLTARSGQPLTARVLGNRADSGGTGVIGSGRADASGASIHGGRFFNLAAFTVPPPGRFGNAGRNTVTGPAVLFLNAAFGRAFRLGEKSRRWLEFRVDSTNVSNRASFTSLGTVINALNYGLPTAAAPMRTVNATVRYRF